MILRRLTRLTNIDHNLNAAENRFDHEINKETSSHELKRLELGFMDSVMMISDDDDVDHGLSN